MAIIFLDSVTSTNTYCGRNIDNLKHADIVRARRQSEGRGRKQRIWSSEEGGLYFSLVLKEGLGGIKTLGLLTQIMALAVCKTARRQGVEAYIKWPNDVLSQGRKFCGILSEAIFDGEKLKAVIIGTGVNVSQDKINSEKPSITLRSLGVKKDAEKLLEDIIANFTADFSLLNRAGFEPLRALYKEYFLYLGKPVTMRVFDGELHGIAEDIDEAGRLVLNEGGKRRLIEIGDMDF